MFLQTVHYATISPQCSAEVPPISVLLVVFSVSYPYFLTNQLLLDLSLDISCPPGIEDNIFSVCGCRCITIVMWTESFGLRLTDDWLEFFVVMGRRGSSSSFQSTFHYGRSLKSNESFRDPSNKRDKSRSGHDQRKCFVWQKERI